MILGIRIDAPKIVSLPEHDIANREHSGQHGMVLIIVTMKPVATNRLKIFQAIYESPQYRKRVAIVGIVDRIGLWNAEDTTTLNVVIARQTDAFYFALSKLNKLGVRHIPQTVSFGAEILKAKACLARIGNHVSAPILKVLDAADLDARVMNINPIIRE